MVECLLIFERASQGRIIWECRNRAFSPEVLNQETAKNPSKLESFSFHGRDQSLFILRWKLNRLHRKHEWRGEAEISVIVVTVMIGAPDREAQSSSSQS
ncbi:unnamed protein product [Thelazia callipaeda]|uniref:Uncharacterized protein n=1 Tax=Thelazia callipaeda TaxID=103827 RepID=A0A0N5D0I2_THECL|nr:unnamed protein product [Thelazia callipaeda]